MIALIIICVVSFFNKASCLEPIFLRQTPKHGTNVPKSVNSFTCPGNGAITAITYYVSNFIHSLTFNCSSSDGIKVFGPYGKETGTLGNFTCPKGQYISSIYGNSGPFLSRLGCRCRPVNKDLIGNGTDFDRMAISSDDRVGPKFDDYGYASGARIVNVTIWNSVEVEAIQLTYANIPVELCTVNCSNYQEEFTPLYGSTGDRNDQLSVFSCPEDGAFTGIKTKVSGGYVKAVQFTCISGVGTWTSPVFGQAMGTTGVTLVECSPNLIFGSMHGRYSSTIIALGVRCVEFRETGESPKYDAQGGGGGTLFDGVKYSDNGWRVIQLRIYYDSSEVMGIQIKYGNSDYNTNCVVTSIEVIDESVQATFEGFEVIGTTTEVCCTSGMQKLKLDGSQGSTQEITIYTENGGSKTFADTVKLTEHAGIELGITSASITREHVSSKGGADTWSSSSSNTTSTSTGQYAGVEITFPAPGACLIVGYVDRYKVNHDNVNVRYHYDCLKGEKASELGNIDLQSTTYGKFYFEDHQIQLKGEDGCTLEVKTCLKNIKADKVIFNSTSLVENFSKCFPSGSTTD